MSGTSHFRMDQPKLRTRKEKQVSAGNLAVGKYVRDTQRTEPTGKENECGIKAHQENSRKKGLHTVDSGMTIRKASGDKDQWYPLKRSSGEKGGEDTKSQDTVNYWILKDYSLELKKFNRGGQKRGW